MSLSCFLVYSSEKLTCGLIVASLKVLQKIFFSHLIYSSYTTMFSDVVCFAFILLGVQSAFSICGFQQWKNELLNYCFCLILPLLPISDSTYIYVSTIQHAS